MRIYNYQSDKLADLVLDFVSEELGPEEVYTREDLLAYVRVNFDPEDVFGKSVLSMWAFDEGYRKFE
jgi:hypothetical protein